MSAPSIAICAVSRSRISPTIRMSGSARIIERRPVANVSPALGLTWTWVMPGIWYSTGSSIVMMFFSGVLAPTARAYSEVDLPEPVGPVTSTAPWAMEGPPEAAELVFLHAQLVELEAELCLSRIRSTTDSPCTLGIVTTRTSTWRPSMVSPTRPSWGIRRSAMSRSLMILIRETTPETIRLGPWSPRSAPRRSRMRTLISRPERPSSSACGSKWMSDAPRSAA